jgi:hypothetical protein
MVHGSFTAFHHKTFTFLEDKTVGMHCPRSLVTTTTTTSPYHWVDTGTLLQQEFLHLCLGG